MLIDAVYLENELDRLDAATYHFKLYMLPMDSIINKEFNSNNPSSYVIAESGTSAEISIDSVTFESYFGMSQQYNTGTSQKFDITLKEPYGSTLLEKMASYADALQIPDFQKIPYFLELTFKGHQNHGTPDDGNFLDQVWRWQICVISVGITISSGGAEYRLSAASYSEHSYANRDGVINFPISISATTVKIFFDQLGAILTVADANEDGSVSGNEWYFTFSDDLADQPLLADGAIMNNNADGIPTATFTKGTGILNILESILSNTDYFQSKIKQSSSSQGTGAEKDKNTAAFAQYFRVYTSADVIGFKPEMNDYLIKNTYYIKVYDLQSLVQEAPNLGGSLTRLNNIIQAGYLKKRYDYIFTGRNTQVIDFNMKFDFSYFIGRPKQKGIGTSIQARPILAAAVTSQSDEDVKNLMTQGGNFAAAPTNNTPTAVPAVGKIPMPAITTNTASAGHVRYGINNSPGNGLTVLSSLLAQAKTGDLAAMDLEIKGDPFWLEPNPVARTDNSPEAGIKSRIDQDPITSVYTKKGNVYLYFNCSAPSIETIFDANPIFLRNNILSAIYRATCVTHTFSGGKFTQKLKAVRSFDIDTSNGTVLDLLNTYNLTKDLMSRFVTLETDESQHNAASSNTSERLA